MLKSEIVALEMAARRAEEEGDYEAALRAWRSLALETGSAASHCQIGRVAKELENWIEAEKAFLDALSVDSHLAIPMLSLGSLYLSRADGDRSGNAKTAKTWLLRAMEIDRNASVSYTHLDVYKRQAVPAAKAWTEAQHGAPAVAGGLSLIHI